ncbi:MAG: peptidylprolyl isomerase, partial [Jannaschia sp.]
MTRLLTGAALALALAAPGHAQDAAATVPADAAPDAATVVANVDGTEITLGHMIAMRARLPEQYQDLPDDVLY